MSWRSTRAAGHNGSRPEQVAVIDLGSNSWRLVVFSYAPGGWWKLTDELYETVRIGEGLGASGKLSDEAMARGIETLAVFARFCRANGLASEQVHAIAELIGHDRPLEPVSAGVEYRSQETGPHVLVTLDHSAVLLDLDI